MSLAKRKSLVTFESVASPRSDKGRNQIARRGDKAGPEGTVLLRAVKIERMQVWGWMEEQSRAGIFFFFLRKTLYSHKFVSPEEGSSGIEELQSSRG